MWSFTNETNTIIIITIIIIIQGKSINSAVVTPNHCLFRIIFSHLKLHVKIQDNDQLQK